MNPEIEAHLVEMRAKYKEVKYDEVVSFGWVIDKPLKINGKKYHPATWGEEFQGQALLVVQLTHWHFLKLFGSTECIGILINKNGSRKYVDATWLMNEVGHP